MWYDKEDGSYVVFLNKKFIIVQIGTSKNAEWLDSHGFGPNVYRTLTTMGRSCSPSEVKDGQWKKFEPGDVWIYA